MNRKTKEIDIIIGDNIAIFRKIRKKNRVWLANQLKISSPQVSNYENAKQRVSASTLYRISEVLDFDIQLFFIKSNCFTKKTK